MAQLKVVYEGKGANLVGKAWRYGAMGGTWEEGCRGAGNRLTGGARSQLPTVDVFSKG